jgi:hypothetical protein
LEDGGSAVILLFAGETLRWMNVDPALREGLNMRFGTFISIG